MKWGNYYKLIVYSVCVSVSVYKKKKVMKICPLFNKNRIRIDEPETGGNEHFKCMMSRHVNVFHRNVKISCVAEIASMVCGRNGYIIIIIIILPFANDKKCKE